MFWKSALFALPALWLPIMGPFGGCSSSGDAIRRSTDLPSTATTVISVPEPTTLLLLASGLAAVGGYAWSRRRRK